MLKNILAFLIIFGSVIASLALSWGYFLCVEIKRAPIGVMNLWDVVFMMAGILIIPYLYLWLPPWVVITVLALETISIICFLLEPIIRANAVLWLLALAATLADIVAVRGWGPQSRVFYAINNLILVLIAVGVSNIWAQSGMKARDAAVLAGFLTIYDFVFTAWLPVMNDLFSTLSGLPFAPMFVWSFHGEGQWLALGLGDVLLATVFPLVMHKAFDRYAGWLAAIVALSVIGILLVFPDVGPWRENFPVMVLLGPLMIAQYAFWIRRRGNERTMREFMQAAV